MRVDEVGAHAGDGGVPPEPPENGSIGPVEIVLRNGRRMLVRSDIAPAALGGYPMWWIDDPGSERDAGVAGSGPY